MRGVLVLAASLALAACGAEERSGGGSASTSAADGPTRSVSAGFAEAQQPPAVVLVSEAGEQEGILGTSCVATEEVEACSFGPALDPQSLSVVRPGEAVTLVLEEAETVNGTLHVLRLGCTEQVAELLVTGPDTEWSVDLEPGLYELELRADFTKVSSGGDMTATVGLQVDAAADPAIVPAPTPLPDCPGQSR